MMFDIGSALLGALAILVMEALGLLLVGKMHGTNVKE